MAIVATLPTLNEPHFDAAEFDQLARAHGTPARWRRAILCPCIHPTHGQPMVDCPFCDNGVLWDDGESVTVLAPGRSRRDEYDVAGLWAQGMAMFTFPSELTPAHLDRLDLTAAEMTVSVERQIRGAANSLGRSAERVRIQPVLEVESCKILRERHLLDIPADTIGIEGDGRIVFLGPLAPDTGELYTLRYRTRPAYVVMSPQSRDEAGNKQPYRAIAQRLDFWRGLVPAGGGSA